MSNAFTVEYRGITNKLITNIEISYGGNTIKNVALWDTGATNCCISKEVVEKLSLIGTGKINIHTPSGTSEVNTYLVDIVLPNKVTINDVRVADSEIGLQGIGMLIGMDIINRGDLAISNVDEKTTFTFRMPSEKKTDYTHQIALQNAIGKGHGKGKRKIKRKK